MNKEQQLDFIESQISGTQPYVDILEKVPDLTWDDAYRLQFALAKRKIAKGNPLIGPAAFEEIRAERETAAARLTEARQS